MGLHKTIQSPDELWQLFLAYKVITKKKPRFRYQLNQRSGRMIKEKLETPLTKEGFYNYVANQDIISTLKDYFANRENRYEDFVPICSRIRDEITQDQIEGGMVGQYNPSITQRLNGLSDKVESRNVDKDGNDVASGSISITLPLGMNIEFPSNLTDETADR